MTNLPTPAWYSDTLTALRAALGRFREAVTEAAQCYVAAIERDPAFRDFIADEMPDVPASLWRALEQVGRGLLDGRIITGGVAYGNRLRRLPIHEQRRAMDETLPLLVGDGDQLAVKLSSLTPDQAEQIFAPDHIRTLEEQRAWIEDRRMRQRISAGPMAPQVIVDKKRKCIEVAGVRIGMADLAAYLSKLSEG